MKLIKILYIALFIFFLGCSLNEDAGLKNNEEINEPVVNGFEGNFILTNRVGRPAINTVLITPNRKKVFNNTLTKDLKNTFVDEIEQEILRFSPAFNNNTDKNILMQDARTLANLFAEDVLNVNLTGKTTFFDGTNVLTGRALKDDVMSIQLLLLFGGEDGTENSELSDDNVNTNDKPFQNSFPYLPTPW